MTRQDMLALFDRHRVAYDQRDVRALANQHAEDGVVESLMAGTVTGRPAISEVYRAWLAAFPDVVVAFNEPLIDGLRAAQATTHTGTDMGDSWASLPPANRSGFRSCTCMTSGTGTSSMSAVSTTSRGSSCRSAS